MNEHISNQEHMDAYQREENNLEELLAKTDEFLEGEDRIDHALQGKGKLEDIKFPIPRPYSLETENTSYEGITTQEEIIAKKGFVDTIKKMLRGFNKILYGKTETITHHQPGLIEQGQDISADLQDTVTCLKKDLETIDENLSIKATYHDELSIAVAKAEITYNRLEVKIKGMKKINGQLTTRLKQNNITMEERANISKRIRALESRERTAQSFHDIYAETLADQYSQIDYLEQEKELDQEQLAKAQKEIYKLESMAAEVTMRAHTSFAESQLPKLIQTVSGLEQRIVGFHQQIHDARLAQDEHFRNVYSTTQTSHSDEQVDGLRVSREQYMKAENSQRIKLHNKVKERMYSRQEKI